MAKQEDIDKENKASLQRQRRSRAQNQARREIRKIERAMLQNATSADQRRNIKSLAEESYKAAIFDLDTSYRPSNNKTDYESDIGQRGIDQFTAPEATPQVPPSAGGDGDGFDLVTFDVVLDDNTAGQYQWRAEEVT